jgi:mono/diheme cytochrome c family protein
MGVGRRNVFRKIAVGACLAFGAALVAFVVLVASRQSRRFDAPLPAIAASTAPAVIERGRYLVVGPAHCIECHGASDDEGHRLHDAAHETVLSGGHTWDLPIGRFHAPNLTADREYGIGAMTDGEIARALRYGVGRDGRALLPFMPFADLGDDDLRAIVSYLRTQSPVHRAVPRHEWNVLGRVMRAFVGAPQGPSQPVRESVPAIVTAPYGEYLTHSVANCFGCHTQRNLRTGEWTGRPFAGGMPFESDRNPGHTFVSANLTPDPATGRITAWSEDAFVARFRAGAQYADSPMPWTAFGRMTDDDLRAIYRYLRSVPAVRNDTPRPTQQYAANESSGSR